MVELIFTKFPVDSPWFVVVVTEIGVTCGFVDAMETVVRDASVM
jgi:F0F1-type ATP synthase assembly protein I